MAIAATFRIDRQGDSFFVPSQSGNGRYKVTPSGTSPHCSCSDHETTGGKCKHIYAVEFFMQRELFDYKEEPAPLPPKAERKIYSQNLTAYNHAQTHEKDRFLDLLRDLCLGIVEPARSKVGRPRLPLNDAVFAACFKIFSTVSGRRFMSDLSAAHEKGFIEKLPHFNTIFNSLENPDLTPILKAMIEETSLPLKSVEHDFAADSSGFSTSRFIRCFDHKYGTVRQQHEWVKVHLMCGVKTNIVTAVEIRDKLAQDAPLMPDLVKATAKSFKIAEVSGDKAYGSYKNYDAIEATGATPFIPFKNRTHNGKGDGLWKKMYH
ncbi:MAG: transposase [Planctomycetia bacterium]|nr:transposase [Planctomycetia bacterium]